MYSNSAAEIIKKMNDSTSLSSFEEFCGNSPFWNTSLTVDGHYPAFTPCFKEVALAWIPTLVLFLVTVPYAVYLKQLPTIPTRGRLLVTVKLTCSVALLAITIAILIYKACDDDQDKIPDALYVSETLKATAFVVASILIVTEKRKGVTSSLVLWLFWILMLTAAIIPFYSNLKEDVKDADEPGFILFYTYFAFVLISFILSSFADNGDGMYKNVHERSSPENRASVPSILSFWWIIGLVIKGVKSDLKKKDVYYLNSSDTSRVLVKKFLRQWKKTKARVQRTSPTNSVQDQISSSYYKKSVINDPLEPAHEKTPLLANRHHSQHQDESSQISHQVSSVSLMKVLMSTNGILFFSILISRTLFDVLTIFTPKITDIVPLFLHWSRALLHYITFRDEYFLWQGYILALSYFVVNLVASLGINQSTFWSKRLGMQLKVTLINAVYKKVLSRSTCKDDTTVGEIINFVSVDSQVIEEVTSYLYLVMTMPVQLAITLYFLYGQLGNAMFAGLGVMLLIIPSNFCIGYFYNKSYLKKMEYKDNRMNLTSEALNGIKVLKLYAWEGSFEEKVIDVRNKEVRCLLHMNTLDSFVQALLTSMPFLVQVVAFAVYINITDDGYLSPTVASVSLSLFNLLNFPLNILPLAMPFFFQAYVAVQRISKFLNKPDIDVNAVQRDSDKDCAVRIQNGSFTWNAEQENTLKDINLKVKKGQFVAVVGTVGCGKSSLLSSMLGEITKLSGRVIVNGSTAYVPQEAWIQNASLKDNILFGNGYRKRKYDKTIDVCALQSDLDILPGGDLTEIGEKGINISGGQKQRVSLARAVYSDQDIYLLDDPLSAVDSHVGKHIFKHILSHEGLLKDKTRILVTHGIHWLPMVDSIIVMEHGLIKETGTYEELVSKDGVFSQILKEHILQESDSDDEDPEVQAMKKVVIERVESITGSILSGNSSADETQLLEASGKPNKVRQRKSSDHKRARLNSSTSHKEAMTRQNSNMTSSYDKNYKLGLSVDKVDISSRGKLIEEETEEEGRVGFNVYMYYFQTIGFRICIAVFFLLLAYTGSSTFIPIWLSEWTDDSLLNNVSRSDEDEYDERTDMYLGVYGAAGVCQGFLILIVSYRWLRSATNASNLIHKWLLANVLRSPMSFFDTTPMGRIVNRFAQDVRNLDYFLSFTILEFFLSVSGVVTTVVIISYGTPVFLAVMVPLIIIYILLQISYVPTSRQLRRMESVSRSPIYVHLTETINGANSIRAYGAQDRLISELEEKMDANSELYFPGVAATSWLSFCLQFLGNIVVFVTAIFTVANTDMKAGLAGMSIAYAAQMTGTLERLINMISEAETNIVAVERIKEYIQSPQEAEWVIPEHRPRPEWPEEGNVVFKDYKTRYRPGLDLVLNNINCNIRGGEKIGIVGRTGAGKSSITVSLFRIIEAAGGNIVIDGEDVSAVGLHDLRSKLTILPQEPVLFSGTLRMNLDPFNSFNDENLWEALGQSNLKDFVKGLPQGLEYECGEGGNNLSIGQRQLVCLARTLLHRTKILVLDEATAAVDMKTDEFIQDTIRREFKDSTVLTIAHRLHTILDYDRVMVLDKGSIVEFDSPNRLLEDEEGIFYSMAKSAGIV